MPMNSRNVPKRLLKFSYELLEIKNFIHFCSKIIFHDNFGKYCFFPKKLINEKYSEPHFLKKIVLIFVARHPLPLKLANPLTNGFSHFFQKILLFSKNLFSNKISGIYILIKKFICGRRPPFPKK